jgi:hypothetical protein
VKRPPRSNPLHSEAERLLVLVFALVLLLAIVTRLLGFSATSTVSLVVAITALFSALGVATARRSALGSGPVPGTTSTPNNDGMSDIDDELPGTSASLPPEDVSS